MEKKNSHPTNRDTLLYRSESRSAATTSSGFVLQWGSRKRLRCMKVHGRGNKRVNEDPVRSELSQRIAVRVDRRVVRSDLNNINKNASKDPIPNPPTISNGFLNLRHRPASPSRRILRNSESPIVMRGHSNGVRGLTSPDRGERKGTPLSNSHHPNNNNNNSNHNNDNHHGGGSGSSETPLDGKRGGSPSSDAAVWPPKFVIALTNKEKEEDFLAIKGSKLPQRPKKRAKLIQRTVNLVCPGAWLCDLTLERYEARESEKKVSKKRPRGLRAMGNNMTSDSE